MVKANDDFEDNTETGMSLSIISIAVTGICAFGAIAIAISWVSSDQYLNIVSSTLNQNAEQGIVARTNNLVNLSSERFTKFNSDMFMASDYVQKIFKGELPIENFYTVYDAVNFINVNVDDNDFASFYSFTGS